ncbi:MAG: TlpA family protein disulfide reductase [Muribaculaceae bacterium]|nr:TlpA family protein disulfide reductase [Muribaculaceae bacterium]
MKYECFSMRNILTILSSIALYFPVYAESNAPGKAIITGRTTAIPDSTEMLLYKMNGNVGECIARDTVMNGEYRFEVPGLTELINADIMTFAPGFPPMSRNLYIAPDAIVEIEGNDPYIYTWPVKSNVKEQAEYDRYLLHNKDLWTQYQQTGIALSEGKDSSGQYRQLHDSISHLIDKREISFLGSAPASEVWLDLFMKKARFIKNYSGEIAEELRAMYERLDDSVKSSAKGAAIKTYLYPEPTLAVGDKIPDNPLYDLDGNEHRFHDLLGKWVLVDIWSTGCGPCIMAIPELNELKENKSDDYEIVSLSIDNESVWKNGTAMFNVADINWNEGVEDRGIYSRLPRHAIPAFLIISPDGTIKDIFHGHSKGIYGRKIRYYTRQNIEPSYSESNGTRLVMHPEYESNSTDCILDIEKIELSDAGTTIYFNLDFIPKYWIEISPNSFLSTPDGKRYGIIDSDGITPGKHLYPDENGKGSFSITFEPTPSSVTDFDFIADDWAINGIKIK